MSSPTKSITSILATITHSTTCKLYADGITLASPVTKVLQLVDLTLLAGATPSAPRPTALSHWVTTDYTCTRCSATWLHDRRRGNQATRCP